VGKGVNTVNTSAKYPVINILSKHECFHQRAQEGQHPLAGQRTTNVRLLANQ